jgi:hypothetical protein
LISQIVATFFLLEKRFYSLKTKETRIEGVCQNTKNHRIQKPSEFWAFQLPEFEKKFARLLKSENLL